MSYLHCQCDKPPTTPTSNNNRCFPHGLGAESAGVSTGGNWSHSESKHHITILANTGVVPGSSVLPVSFFDQTPLDSRFRPLESSREYWTCVAALQLLRGKPVHLEAGKDLLQLPSHPKETHPMWHKLSFLVCLLSRRD